MFRRFLHRWGWRKYHAVELSFSNPKTINEGIGRLEIMKVNTLAIYMFIERGQPFLGLTSFYINSSIQSCRILQSLKFFSIEPQ